MTISAETWAGAIIGAVLGSIVIPVTYFALKLAHSWWVSTRPANHDSVASFVTVGTIPASRPLMKATTIPFSAAVLRSETVTAHGFLHNDSTSRRILRTCADTVLRILGLPRASRLGLRPSLACMVQPALGCISKAPGWRDVPWHWPA